MDVLVHWTIDEENHTERVDSVYMSWYLLYTVDADGKRRSLQKIDSFTLIFESEDKPKYIKYSFEYLKNKKKYCWIIYCVNITVYMHKKKKHFHLADKNKCNCCVEWRISMLNNILIREHKFLPPPYCCFDFQCKCSTWINYRPFGLWKNNCFSLNL